MTTVAELDSRGVDALKGDELLLPEVIWFQLVDELGPVPVPPAIEPFDDQPWLDMWDAHPVELPLGALIHELAMRSYSGPDLGEFLATQRMMAQIELDRIREQEARDGREGTDDVGAAGEDASVASAAALGGGGDVPGEREDGDPVVQGGEATGDPDSGRAPKVQRRRNPGNGRKGKAA